MPDITMCTNANCPIKSNCKRWLSQPDTYQSYWCFEYNKDKGCEFQMPIK